MPRPFVCMSRLLPLIVCAAPLLAQGVSTQLGGTVNKKGAGPLAGATVVIRQEETGFVRSVQSDANGHFLAVALPVGPYSVTVTKDGYQTASNIKITLNLGGSAPLTIQLPAKAEATVEVNSVVGMVDTDRTTVAAFVSPDSLTNLPVANRSYTALASLTPTAAPDTHNGNLSIAGQRGVNTSINIDGGDANEPFFGGAMGSTSGSPFMVSMESIKEYQVISGGASAEFGRMGGGYLNAITKSGTNQLEGTLWLYEFPKSMVATQPNLSGVPGANAILDFSKYQFGFNVGGAILKDKLFYFVNYDGQRATTPVNFLWGGNNPVTLNASNAADAVLLGQAGSYNVRANLDTVSVRLDWIASVDHNLSLTVKRNQFTSDYYTGQTDAFSTTEPDITKNTTIQGQWDWTINGKWINSLRLNYAEDNLPRTTRSNIPQVYIKNVGYYGANPYPRDFDDKRTQFIETIQYVEPKYQIKAGIDYSNLNMSETFSGGWQGQYSFSSLANYELGNWTTYSQRFAGPGSPGMDGWTSGAFSSTEQQMAVFVQADLQATETVKLGLGLRWDHQTEPSFPILDYSNPLASTLPVTANIPSDSAISPRLNVTWNPRFDAGLVVRASMGRYVSVTQGIYLDQVYASNGQRQQSVTYYATDPNHDGIPYGSTFNPASPFAFSSLPTGGTVAKPQVISFAPGFKNPRTNQATLGADQALGHWVVGISAIYAKGTNLERLTDLNLGTSTVNAYGRDVFPNTGTAVKSGSPIRPNSNYGQMLAYVSDAESLYHAYTLTAKYQTPESPWSAQVNYTYSINKDNDSNERSYNSYYAQNPQNLGAEWSYSDGDRRNVLTGMLTFMDKKWTGIEVGFVLKYLSGLPYSILATGADPSYLGASGNARLYVNGQDTGRNTQRTSSVTDMDLKLSRDWRLGGRKRMTLSAEIFNLMNRQDTYQKLSATSSNNLDPYTVMTTPTYMNTTNNMSSPRNVQLGLRVAF